MMQMEPQAATDGSVEDPGLPAGLKWEPTVVPAVRDLLARGKRPASYGRLGMEADIVTWLVLEQDDQFGMPVTALVAVVSETCGLFRCNVCGRKGQRPTGEQSRVALSIHFSVAHAMVGRGDSVAEPLLEASGEHQAEADAMAAEPQA